MNALNIQDGHRLAHAADYKTLISCSPQLTASHRAVSLNCSSFPYQNNSSCSSQ